MKSSGNPFGGLLYNTLWMLSLSLTSVLRQKTVVQLWTDYMGLGLRTMVFCSYLIFYASWNLSLEIKYGAIWLYNNYVVDYLLLSGLEIQTDILTNELAQKVVDFIPLALPIIIVVCSATWTAKSLIKFMN